MDPVTPPILARFSGKDSSPLVKRTTQPRLRPLGTSTHGATIPTPTASGIATGASVANVSAIKRNPKPNTPVECKRCKTTLPSAAALIRHCVFEHLTQPGWKTRVLPKKEIDQYKHLKRKLVCGTCGICVFDSKEEVKQHMIDEHGLKCCPVRDESVARAESSMPLSMQVKLDPSKSPHSVRSYSPESQQKRILPKPTAEGLQATNFLREEALSDDTNSGRMEAFWRTITPKSLLEWYQHEKPHKCSRKGCPYKFASYEVREQHLRCHAENDSTPDGCSNSTAGVVVRKRFTFKCIRCDRKFDSWKPCLAHLWHDHQTDLGMLRCLLCEKRFTYVVHVLKHMHTHRPKALRDVACRYGCGQKFANAAQRSVHETALHRRKGTGHGEEQEQEVEQKLRWYSERRCNICKHMFSNTKILSKHIKTVHLQIKPFVCNVCGYKCARKATLNIHIRQHSGLKPLACKSCPFRTADPSALSYHERRHRLEKAYRCQICGIRLTQPSTLRYHMQSQHPQEYQRMKCTLCDYTSINAQNLRRHQANHKAGLIQTNDEDSRPEAEGGTRERNETHHSGRLGGGSGSTIGRAPDNVPEISSDCFLPLESVDSMVHDTGGITIPAAVVTLPAALSEETQFPI